MKSNALGKIVEHGSQNLRLWAEDSTVQLMMLSVVNRSPQRTVSSEGFGGKALGEYLFCKK